MDFQENMRVVKRLIVSSPRGVRQDGNNGIYICCVRCGEWKRLGEFGLRYMSNDDTLRNQSHCIACRAEQRSGT